MLLYALYLFKRKKKILDDKGEVYLLYYKKLKSNVLLPEIEMWNRQVDLEYFIGAVGKSWIHGPVSTSLLIAND